MRPLGVSLHWRYLTLSQKVPKNAFLSYKFPKINLNRVADSVFDLRNEFYANRMSFGILWK
jgi:hypothetical protein